MKNLKYLLLIIVMFFSTLLTKANNFKKEKNKKFNYVIVDISSIDFSKDGLVESMDFVRGSCSEVRDGVTYSTSVGCFLCGDERANERCKRILSNRLDELNPQRD